MKKFFTLLTLMTLIAFGAQAQKQVYTVFNNGTLTYYYDDQMDTRSGIKELYSAEGRFKDYGTEVHTAVIDASMKQAPLTFLNNLFRGFRGGQYYSLRNLTSVTGLGNLNTEIVTNMAFFFDGCMSLQSIDLSSFNTANVTNMDAMFRNCECLTEIKGLEKFNTAQVKDMSDMFYGCKSLPSIDLSSFNTANVTDMDAMFQNCERLTEIKGLEKFNTAKVEDMFFMFFWCESLQSIDLRSFNWDKVTDVRSMFSDCHNLATIYCDEDLSAKTGLASENMFTDCNKLVGGNGTNFDSNNIDAAYARPDGLDYKKGYFTGTMPVYTVCNSGTLTYYCDYKMDSRSGIKEVYDPAAKRFEGYNEMVTRAVIDPSMAKAQLTSLRYMFYSEDGSYFGNLPNLTTITGLEYLNTANVTDMSGMFTGCWALTDPLNLSNFNTANVTNMNFMFGGCSELTELDLTAFDVDKVTSMDYMFTNCKKLKTIYCETDWTTGAVTSSTNMFDNCKVIQGDNGTKWAAGNQKDISYARPDGGTENPGYFSQKPTEGIENIQPSVVSTQKVIRDGQLYIMYNGTMYNVQGLKVK